MKRPTKTPAVTIAIRGSTAQTLRTLAVRGVNIEEVISAVIERLTRSVTESGADARPEDKILATKGTPMMENQQSGHDSRAQMYARLMRDEHMNTHGGAFVIGDAVGVFSNMGDRSETFVKFVHDSLVKQGIRVVGFGRSGKEPGDEGGRAEDDYSWAMLVDVRPDNRETLEDLVQMVFNAVCVLRNPNYGASQFRLIE